MLLRLKKKRQDGKWFMKFRFECIVLFDVQLSLKSYKFIVLFVCVYTCLDVRNSNILQNGLRNIKKILTKFNVWTEKEQILAVFLLLFNRSRSRSLTELTRLIIPPTKIVLVPTWARRCTIWTWILTSPMHTLFYCPTEIRLPLLRKVQVYNFV